MNHVFPLWSRLKEYRDFDVLDAVTILTAFCLLFISIELRVLAGLIVLTAIFFRNLRRSPWFWLVVAVGWWPQLILRWEHHEDHCYLINYWCIALGLSLLGRNSYRILKTNARLLIGLTFAFGCFWKITSPDFMDNSVSTHVLLFDWRFNAGITAPLGLVPDQVANEQAVSALYSQLDAGMPQKTQVGFKPALGWLAQAMTWWTIAIEATVAILFLLPGTTIARRFKDASLMTFAFTTYLFVPVVAFGCLFCAMGAAQCEHQQRRTRIAYMLLALFVMVRNNMVVYL